MSCYQFFAHLRIAYRMGLEPGFVCLSVCLFTISNMNISKTSAFADSGSLLLMRGFQIFAKRK